jgi:TolB protein
MVAIPFSERCAFVQPSWRGSRIESNSLTEGDEEIYTIKPDGGGRQPVTDNSSDDYSPSYSPSGKRIAYVNSAGTDSEIWTIQPGGGGRQQVTDNANNDRDPYWGSQ